VLIFRVFEINNDFIGSSKGDDDNLIDAGETIELRLEAINNGNEDANNVYGNLTTNNPFVTLLTYNQSYLQVAAGETAMSVSYYILEFNSKLNVSDEISFSVLFTADEGSWSDDFNLTIMGCAEPAYYGYKVFSEANGDLNSDNDGVIDPREIVYIQLFIENMGESILFNANGQINTSDTFITITDDSGVFGTVEENGDYSYGNFAMRISGACSINYHFSLNLSIVDKFNHFWNLTIEFVVSGHPQFELESIILHEYSGDEDN